MHDATTLNRQGPDVGTQYRSVIFTHGEEQQKIAEQITDKVSEEWYKKPVSTQVIPAGQWWDAEEYHQLYLNKNPAGYECPAQYVDPVLPMTFLHLLASWLLTGDFFCSQLRAKLSSSFRVTRVEDIRGGFDDAPRTIEYHGT